MAFAQFFRSRKIAEPDVNFARANADPIDECCGNLRWATVAATLSGAAQLTQSYGYDSVGRLQTASSESFSAEYVHHANSSLASTASHRYVGNYRMATTEQYSKLSKVRIDPFKACLPLYDSFVDQVRLLNQP